MVPGLKSSGQGKLGERASLGPYMILNRVMSRAEFSVCYITWKQFRGLIARPVISSPCPPDKVRTCLPDRALKTRTVSPQQEKKYLRTDTDTSLRPTASQRFPRHHKHDSRIRASRHVDKCGLRDANSLRVTAENDWAAAQGLSTFHPRHKTGRHSSDSRS